jgi:hypothetical protein
MSWLRRGLSSSGSSQVVRSAEGIADRVARSDEYLDTEPDGAMVVRTIAGPLLKKRKTATGLALGSQAHGWRPRRGLRTSGLRR